MSEILPAEDEAWRILGEYGLPDQMLWPMTEAIRSRDEQVAEKAFNEGKLQGRLTHVKPYIPIKRADYTTMGNPPRKKAERDEE